MSSFEGLGLIDEPSLLTRRHPRPCAEDLLPIDRKQMLGTSPSMLVSADANIRAGKFDIVTEDFTKLTGKRPQSLKDFFVAHKAALTA